MKGVRNIVKGFPPTPNLVPLDYRAFFVHPKNINPFHPSHSFIHQILHIPLHRSETKLKIAFHLPYSNALSLNTVNAKYGEKGNNKQHFFGITVLHFTFPFFIANLFKEARRKLRRRRRDSLFRQNPRLWLS